MPTRKRFLGAQLFGRQGSGVLIVSVDDTLKISGGICGLNQSHDCFAAFVRRHPLLIKRALEIFDRSLVFAQVIEQGARGDQGVRHLGLVLGGGDDFIVSFQCILGLAQFQCQICHFLQVGVVVLVRRRQGEKKAL